MPGPHDRIIAQAAKIALHPLGFQRKGRSRTWLADHGWWLTIVEFQPSAWSKGSYLNVAAHWLWSEMGHLSFDFGNRVAEFVEYHSDDQFTPAAARLADTASEEAQRLAQTFTSVSATADVLLSEVRRTHEPGQGSWMAYNAGVAAALVGRRGEAAEMFGRTLRCSAGETKILTRSAERMGRLADEPSAIRAEVAALISGQREALRLPALNSPPV